MADDRALSSSQRRLFHYFEAECNAVETQELNEQRPLVSNPFFSLSQWSGSSRKLAKVDFEMESFLG